MFKFKEKLTFKTKLSSLEILEALQKYVEPPINGIDWRVFQAKKPFTGKLENHSFEIWKTPQGKSSAFAKAKGAILSSASGTIVQVEISLLRFMVIFIGIWLGITSLGSITFLGFYFSGNLLSEGVVSTAIFIPLMAPVLLVFIFIFGYYTDKNRLKNNLKDILEAEIETE